VHVSCTQRNGEPLTRLREKGGLSPRAREFLLHPNRRKEAPESDLWEACQSTDPPDNHQGR